MYVGEEHNTIFARALLRSIDQCLSEAHFFVHLLQGLTEHKALRRGRDVPTQHEKRDSPELW